MRALPKVELHLHLEGAAPPRLIREMAAEKSVDLSGIFTEDGRYRYTGFAGFLRTYEAVTTVLRSPRDFTRLTAEVLEASAAEGVVYTEILVAPDFCGGRDLSAWREHLDAIGEAVVRAEAAHGIVARLVVTAVRHFGPDAARQVALCAAETAGPLVTGFGLAGDEGAGRAADFAWPFDMAREAGLGLTAHSGEWRGPDAVRETLDHLRVARLGHGVRAVEDPALVRRLAEDGVVLEVCPGSNVALGVYGSLSRHPIARLRQAGVPVTVSTDDPPFFDTTMSGEYERLAGTFGWDEAVFLDLASVAAGAAFCDEKTRAGIVERITP